MIIETKELKLSKKIEMVCRFDYVDYTIKNGNIKSIKNTNVAYAMPILLKLKATIT